MVYVGPDGSLTTIRPGEMPAASGVVVETRTTATSVSGYQRIVRVRSLTGRGEWEFNFDSFNNSPTRPTAPRSRFHDTAGTLFL